MRAIAAIVCLWIVLAGGVAGPPGAAWAQIPVPQPAQPPRPGQPGQPQPAPASAPADPRLAQIKANVERQGMRVEEVILRPASGESPAWWFVFVPAAYAQPSVAAASKQAQDTWWAMYTVLAQEQPLTVMVSAQVWTKYILQIYTSTGEYSQFLSTYRAAQTDAQRSASFDGLLQRTRVRVWDMERREFTDAKDFINKNFTR